MIFSKPDLVMLNLTVGDVQHEPDMIRNGKLSIFTDNSEH